MSAEVTIVQQPPPPLEVDPALAVQARRMTSFPDMIQRVSDRFGQKTAVEWTKAVLAHQATINEDALRRAIASGNVDRIEAVIDSAKLQRRVSQAIAPPLLEAAQTAGRESVATLARYGITASFQALHPNVVQFARDQAAQLVVKIPHEVKQVIAEVIARGAANGLTVQEQARAIRQVVGLPPNWAAAPTALEQELRSGTLSAADRRLSAAVKQQIRSRINSGGMTETFIKSTVKTYTAGLIQARAYTIARTETNRAAHAGLHESWKQASDNGDLPDTARRFWLVTPDNRLSAAHATIPGRNPAGRRMDEPFDTTEGPCMYPPSRPNCRCSVGLAFTGGKNVITGPSGAPVNPGAPPQPPRRQVEAPPPMPVTPPPAPFDVPVATARPSAIGRVEEAAILARPSSFYEAVRPAAKETLERFYANSQFTPQRQELHNAIEQKILGNAKPVAQPEVIVLGGGPASGKSSALRGLNLTNHVVIDVDHVRSFLPEYKEGLAAKQHDVAAMTHEEASLLAKQIVADATARHLNVLLDGTGNSGYAKLSGKVRAFRAKGYRVVGRYVTADTNTAYERMMARGAQTGRYVPEQYFRATHRDVSTTFASALREGLFDEATLYDNNGSAPVEVAHAVGKNVTIHDQALWSRFRDKAVEDLSVPLRPVTPAPSPSRPIAPESTARTPSGLPAPEVHKAVVDTLHKIGVDPSLVRYSNDLGSGRIANVGGDVLGEYSDGRITLNPNRTAQQVAATVAHEATHLKFDVALRTDPTLAHDIQRDYAALAEEDGVTDYSRGHWDAATERQFQAELKGKSLPEWQRQLPVDETLAEIRAMEVAGRKVGTPRYRDLLDRIDKAYKKAVADGQVTMTPSGHVARRVAPLRRMPRPLGYRHPSMRALGYQDETVIRRPPVSVDTQAITTATTPSGLPITSPITTTTGIDAVVPKVWNRLSSKERELLRGVKVTRAGGTIMSNASHRLVNGHYMPNTKSIELAKKSNWNTAAHEIGHAIDHALGGSHYLSDDPEFKRLVEKGLAREAPSGPAHYYTDFIKRQYKPDKYSTEVFADIWATTRAKARVRMDMATQSVLKKQFPEAFQWVKDKLAAAGVQTGRAPVSAYVARKVATPAETAATAPRIPRGVRPEVHRVVMSEAEHQGINPKMIKFSKGVKKAAQIPGYEGRTIGYYSPRTQHITLDPSLPEDQYYHLVAHEATHLKFDAALKTDPTLREDILKDWEGLKADDGVTPYSTAHWNQANAQEASGQYQTAKRWLTPVNETLAEIREEEARGAYAGSMRYQKLLERVDKAYAASQKGKKAARELAKMREAPVLQRVVQPSEIDVERAMRARSTYKPSTVEKQRKAEAEQARAAKLIGLHNTEDNAPFDLLGNKVGVEVKTLLDNNNEKITVHPDARMRKEKFARKNGLKRTYTLAIDARGGRRKYYIKEGVGAFRISSMQEVTIPELKTLLQGEVS